MDVEAFLRNEIRVKEVEERKEREE